MRLSDVRPAAIRVLAEHGPASATEVARHLWPGTGRRRRGFAQQVLKRLTDAGLAERDPDRPEAYRLTDQARRVLTRTPEEFYAEEATVDA